MTDLSAGPPLERPRHRVGRTTVTVVDPARPTRPLGVELWYPAVHGDQPLTQYELFPGVAFTSASAHHDAPAAPGKWPLILFSHGRSGMRINYSMICEALAARGAVVASADHPGDALADWLSGNHVDDRTNETNRVADAHAVLAALTHGHDAVPVGVVNAIDHRRIVIAGHSYGAYTAFATAAGARGVEPHPHVAAVIGFQPYMRSMSDGLLGRVRVPALMVVSSADTVTPPSVDADRPWALLPGRPLWRLDLEGAGHQATSDISLYAEAAPKVPFLPQLVRDYLAATAAGSASAAGRGWRDVMRIELDAAWAFLQVALGFDEDAGRATAETLDGLRGVSLRTR